MTIFFRLLESDDKGTALHQAIQQLAQQQPNPVTFTVEPESFQQVPGSPFAYWVSQSVRDIFEDCEKLNSGKTSACLGLQTQNDFRFLRLFFEVSMLLSVESIFHLSKVVHSQGFILILIYALTGRMTDLN